jgi:hypothetical protein
LKSGKHKAEVFIFQGKKQSWKAEALLNCFPSLSLSSVLPQH